MRRRYAFRREDQRHVRDGEPAVVSYLDFVTAQPLRRKLIRVEPSGTGGPLESGVEERAEGGSLRPVTHFEAIERRLSGAAPASWRPIGSRRLCEPPLLGGMESFTPIPNVARFHDARAQIPQPMLPRRDRGEDTSAAR